MPQNTEEPTDPQVLVGKINDFEEHSIFKDDVHDLPLSFRKNEGHTYTLAFPEIYESEVRLSQNTSQKN